MTTDITPKATKNAGWYVPVVGSKLEAGTDTAAGKEAETAIVLSSGGPLSDMVVGRDKPAAANRPEGKDESPELVISL